MKHRIFTLVIILSTHLAVFGQTYTGVVADADGGKVLPGASVRLYGKDNKYINGIATDAAGRFSVKTSGKAYKVVVTFVGYQRYMRKDSLGLPETIGHIGLQNGHLLKEVVANSSMRKQNIDTDEYLITDSLRKGTLNAFQLLEKLPGMRHDWVKDNISVDGEDDVVLIVDGIEKPVKYISKLNPKRIRSVEVQHYPVGKYSEHAVVVNIKLTERYRGWDFSPTYIGGYRTIGDTSYGGPDIPFTYTIDKWNIYGLLSPSYLNRRDGKSLETVYDGKFEKKSDQIDESNPNKIDKRFTGKLMVGADYNLSKNHRLSFMGNLKYKDVDAYEFYNLIYAEGGKTERRYQRSADRYYTQDHTMGLFYKGKIGGKMGVNSDLSYNYYQIKDKRTYTETGSADNLNWTKGRKDYVRYYVNVSSQLSDKLNFFVDYAITWRRYDNSDRITGSGIYHSNSNRNRASLALTYKPLDNFSIRTGLGVDNMNDNNTSGSINHTSWQPRGWIFWKPFKKITFRTTYDCQTSYPSLDLLSTNEYKVDTWITHQGNPFLRQSVMHNINSQVTIDKWFTFRYMLGIYNDVINNIYSFKNDGMIKESYFNADRKRSIFGLNGYYNLGGGVGLYADVKYGIDMLKNKAVGCDVKEHFWTVSADLDYTIKPLKLQTRCSYYYLNSMVPKFQGKESMRQNLLSLSFMRTFLKGRMPVTFVTMIPFVKRDYTTINLGAYRSRTDYTDGMGSSLGVHFVVAYYFSGGKSTKRSRNSIVTDKEK